MEVKLPDVCRIQYGFAFDSAQFSTTTGIPLIRIRDVVRGYSETYTTEECSEEYFVNDGDILIGMDGEFNIARWQGGRALLNQRVCRLFPSERIDPGYLFYFMPQALKRIEEQTPFVTVKHLSAKQLNSISIPLPELGEQQRIATVLDKISGLISFRKQQLGKLDELVKARFVEMFGDIAFNPNKYPSAKLGDIAFITKLAGFEYTEYIHYQDHGDIIMVRGLNCKKTKLMLNDIYWIDKKTSDMLPRSKLFAGDILMTYVGTVGEVALIDVDDRYHLAPNVAKISLKNKHEHIPRFFAHMFMYCRDYIMSHASSTTQAALSMGKIRDIVFPIPPSDEQTQFSTFVEEVDKSRLTIQQSLDKLEVLKKALMQEYFGGD